MYSEKFMMGALAVPVDIPLKNTFHMDNPSLCIFNWSLGTHANLNVFVFSFKLKKVTNGLGRDL